ncbi:MAG: hypothetical protein KDN19_21750 [Verrucomicrobiae bacterium]|nr:hypothetical protein [Verrucomicrobiae bacterium]
MNDEIFEESIEFGESAHHQHPVLRFRGSTLVLENGAVLPSECCVKCGRPATKVIRKKLRKPTNPMTWFGKRETIDVGLCKKHHESRLIALALTWSCLVVGVGIFVFGLISLEFVSCFIGLLFAGISGVFRACYPCCLKSLSEDALEIGGVGEGCRTVLEKAGAVESETTEESAMEAAI